MTTGLFWWHPVVWWARRELREAEEQCCDAWVVWALPGAGRTYATALLECLDFLSPSLVPLPEGASGLVLVGTRFEEEVGTAEISIVDCSTESAEIGLLRSTDVVDRTT